MHRRTLTVATVLLLGAPAATAAASPSAAAAALSAGQARVVLTLPPADGDELSAAALRPPATAEERRSRAAALRPSAAARRQVQRQLAEQGWQVERETPWTLTATRTARRGEPAPTLPVTAAAEAADTGGPVMRPRAVPAGFGPEQLRAAYAVPGASPDDGARPWDGAGTAVATVQFSGWLPSDAATFARGAGIPLAEGQITTHAVAGASPTQPDGYGGDFEVALDVQAVLGGAPAARQHVYVGPNSAAGAVAVYDAVATHAEQHGLAAVSISWGACEAGTDPRLVDALEPHLGRMVAAGATVLAASGDAGAYGCATHETPDPRLAVDYPAASPSVLAVGGTSLRRTADGWSETAWSDRSEATDRYAGQGSGGGLSGRFPRPLWQAGVVVGGGDRRAVPDVSGVADPRTGLGVYVPLGAGGRGWAVAGGTSATAPMLAGQLASALSAAGRTLGVGDVHVPVYAASGTPALRDVVTGDNLRHRAGPGHDLATGVGSPQWSVLGPLLLSPALLAAPSTDRLVVPVAAYAPTSRTARYALGEQGSVRCEDAAATTVPALAPLAPGPDRETALVLAVRDGEDCRTATAPLVLDRTGPVARSALATTARRGVLALRWDADDPAPSAGTAAVAWRLVRTDTGAAVATGTASRSGSALRRVPPGSYALQVAGTDAVGNAGARAVSATVRVP